MLGTLLVVVALNGATTFWPRQMVLIETSNEGSFLGEIVDRVPSRQSPDQQSLKLKVANRDLYGLDFRWIEQADIVSARYPETALQIERMEYGPMFLVDGEFNPNGSVSGITAKGQNVTVSKDMIVRHWRPNAMGFFSKFTQYLSRWWNLLLDEPREANTEGGLFPSIFGTILLIFVMSIFSFPFGVIAGVYMKEYARDGWLLRTVRVAVNNLAGIPSIVFGIFGLGFFVYGIGGTIDQLFFEETLPNPTFGTGGLLWASLTLGLLTVPVVIVSTEEALSVIPKGIRESSLALGASQFQTLTRVLLPMASPGILTGFILAMTRAAGEVAPLMLTGVVKLAPSLPLDAEFPFIHLDRKFMHLGFHIYDIGFQSPNVEAAKPMVYVTTLLLLFIVVAMNSGAISLRNRMKHKYSTPGV